MSWTWGYSNQADKFRGRVAAHTPSGCSYWIWMYLISHTSPLSTCHSVLATPFCTLHTTGHPSGFGRIGWWLIRLDLHSLPILICLVGCKINTFAENRRIQMEGDLYQEQNISCFPLLASQISPVGNQEFRFIHCKTSTLQLPTFHTRQHSILSKQFRSGQRHDWISNAMHTVYEILTVLPCNPPSARGMVRI